MLLGLLLISTAATLASPGEAGGDAAELLTAVRNAFESNRLLFEHGSTEFVHLIGSSPDADAAMGRGPDRGVVAGRGVYRYDGPNALMERIFPEQSGGPKRSIRLSTDGTRTLQAWEGLPLIQKGTDSFYDEVRVPISIGQLTPRESMVRIIDLAIRNERGCRLASKREGKAPGGEPALILKFEADDFVNEYWIDLERGAIPLATKSTNRSTGISRHERYFGIVKHDQLGWLPGEWRSYLGTGKLNTHIVKFTKTDFSSSLSPADFSIRFPRATRVVDASRGLVYPAGNSCNLNTLPSADAPGVQRSRGERDLAPAPGPRPPDMPGELAAGGTSIPLISSALLLLAAAYVGTSRWRRGRGSI